MSERSQFRLLWLQYSIALVCSKYLKTNSSLLWEERKQRSISGKVLVSARVSDMLQGLSGCFLSRLYFFLMQRVQEVLLEHLQTLDVACLCNVALVTKGQMCPPNVFKVLPSFPGDYIPYKNNLRFSSTFKCPLWVDFNWLNYPPPWVQMALILFKGFKNKYIIIFKRLLKCCSCVW